MAMKRRSNSCHQACDRCKRGHLKCDGEMPCERCRNTGGECNYSEGKRRGPKPKRSKSSGIPVNISIDGTEVQLSLSQDQLSQEPPSQPLQGEVPEEQPTPESEQSSQSQETSPIQQISPLPTTPVSQSLPSLTDSQNSLNTSTRSVHSLYSQNSVDQQKQGQKLLPQPIQIQQLQQQQLMLARITGLSCQPQLEKWFMTNIQKFQQELQQQKYNCEGRCKQLEEQISQMRQELQEQKQITNEWKIKYNALSELFDQINPQQKLVDSLEQSTQKRPVST